MTSWIVTMDVPFNIEVDAETEDEAEEAAASALSAAWDVAHAIFNMTDSGVWVDNAYEIGPPSHRGSRMTTYRVTRVIVEHLDVTADSENDALMRADDTPIAQWTRDIKDQDVTLTMYDPTNSTRLPN